MNTNFPSPVSPPIRDEDRERGGQPRRFREGQNRESRGGPMESLVSPAASILDRLFNADRTAQLTRLVPNSPIKRILLLQHEAD